MKQAVAAILILICVLTLSNCEDIGDRVYDCGMAEWHPDIPPAVKEECRKRFKESQTGVTT